MKVKKFDALYNECGEIKRIYDIYIIPCLRDFLADC